MPERYFAISEAAKRLGVHPVTLRDWEKKGKIHCIRTIGGKRRFPESEVLRLLGEPLAAEVKGQPRAVIYARVSTQKQAESGNLERQKGRLMNYCLEKGYAIVGVYEDVASGLNAKRRGLMKLLKIICQSQVDKVVVEFQDRLARFGFEYLEYYSLYFGVTIEILNGPETKDLHQELVEDLLSIVTSFSARVYGSRGGRVAKKVAILLEEEKCIE